MDTRDPKFEQYWNGHKTSILMKDDEYRAAVETYRMRSGSDWLLFGIPVMAGIVSMQFIPIEHELLRWVASILITIVVFVICVYVKSLSNPHRAISDIEADVKKKAYEEYLSTGRLPE